MNKLLLSTVFAAFIVSLVSFSSFAQTPPGPSTPQAPEMVLMPRQLIEQAASWIAQPDSTIAVKLYAALGACLKDNPSQGIISNQGNDACKIVSDAIAARNQEIKNLEDQIKTLSAKTATKTP